ncbi:glycosyltransferase family 4 protein [Pelosinus sp. UFO1]|uniref:glycosyltransferase family 4 protein n=1 Tax=Pelosinus sp. UFO1 TaxID=484770 RepID=UPI0004D0CA06|nr:glycosyltransferase family 4 protein [Pelosinus sp. UFO1]AIF53736.1 glycosyl transferase group 1 [Pelosinus sp. UFO1]
MNILILFSQPWRVGGAETHVEALLKGLEGHNLFLAVNEGSNEEKLAQLKQNFPRITIVIIQARGANLLRWKKDLAMLCDLVKREHIDVISAQQRTAGIWAHIIRYYMHIPYTVTMHDPWHRAMFKSIYAKMFTAIFVVSRNLANKLIQNFGFSEKQIFLINNGIDFQAFKPTSKEVCREKLGLAPEDKMILHVSRLSNVKGAVSLTVIESMKYVLKKRTDVRLVIIGEGPMRDEINDKIAEFNQMYGDKIKIYDFVTNITDWYNATDILVGEGRVAMETLACMKPIVAIRNVRAFIGSIDAKNIAYACDVNFDGNDQMVTPENMAKEIEKALQLDANESAKIAEYIKERLSLENMAKAYLDVFKEMK